MRCLACLGGLADEGTRLLCVRCGASYDVADGVPVLIRPGNPDFRPGSSTGPVRRRPGWLERLVTSRLKHRSAECFALMTSDLCRSFREQVLILVIGGGEAGIGMEQALREPGLRWVETDIYRGSRTRLLIDGHELPFFDGTFHGVVLQSVLEHVRDPVRVAREAVRVLKTNGLLLSQAAFVQQVHLGRFDYYRFTPRAHRLLFASCKVETWGAALGPATALVWAWRYLLRALLAPLPGGPAFAYACAWPGLLAAYLMDKLLVHRMPAMEAASETYLLVRKVEPPVANADAFPDTGPE